MFETKCPRCMKTEIKKFRIYKIKNGQERTIFQCNHCGTNFSETCNTALAGLRNPISLIGTVLLSITEGTGINAATRIFNVSKNSIYRWQKRLGDLKETLMLFALANQFIQQVIEGDELYTKVDKNHPQDQSAGWTIVLMDRATRFIWDMQCGRKDREMFQKAITCLSKVLDQAEELTLLTDGERRYGNLLFEICSEVVKTGKRGRPRKTLPKGVKVRIKNKGSQSHKKGRKRQKYQDPQPEHPETIQNIENKEIHANHLEAFNASLRRLCAAYRRRTNTYAKKENRLQERLDLIWIFHNFTKIHFTTRQVPAVALGIMKQGIKVENLFYIQKIG